MERNSPAGARENGPRCHLGRGATGATDQEQRRAWNEALRFLAVSARSRFEVERKLGKSYDLETVTRIVARLVQRRWLDDSEFARSFVVARSQFGERRLFIELRRKGVEPDLALNAIREIVGEVDVVAKIADLAAKRLRSMQNVDRNTARRRLTGYLLRRGFSLGRINSALEPLLHDLPSPQAGAVRRGFGRISSTAEAEE